MTTPAAGRFRKMVGMSDPGRSFRVFPCGEAGISVEFGNAIEPAVNARVRHLFQVLKIAQPIGLVDLIPSYHSLFIEYDPCLCSFERLLCVVEDAIREGSGPAVEDGPVVEIPVCYADEYGPDAEELAAVHLLSVEDMILIHSSPIYTVYMIGFMPGFPYLGGLDERLITPRRQAPRRNVPAGSVGIADRQTGIYPLASPGGWQLIGRTPLRLFDPSRPEPFLLKTGDRVRFIPISKDAFESH
jgi:inhibitor of KinA